MKTKNNLRSKLILKLFLILPLILLFLFAVSSCAAKKKAVTTKTEIAPPPPPPPPPTIVQSSESVDEEVPFVVVEEMPVFPGGDSAILKYIAENVKYPEASKSQKIQGRVIVRFCVTTKGGVDRISVIRGVAPDLDAESIRVVQTLPGFKPGRQGGKEVPVWYMVPITFALK